VKDLVHRATTGPRRGWTVAALFVLTVLVGLICMPSLADMADRGVDIVPYELARTSERAAELNARLGPDGRRSARITLVLDYAFLVAYGLFAAAACLVIAARCAERGRPRLARLGPVFAIGALVAALCDAIENAALLRIAGGNVDQPGPLIAFTFASAKFALLAAALAYGVVALASTVGRPAADPAT